MSLEPLHFLQVHNLSCERDGRQLFAGLGFEVKAGSAVQIEGPNGAGKTTLLRTLTGAVSDFVGEIRWNGEPFPDALPRLRESLLYIGHRAGVRGGLTPLENLAWYGADRDTACRALEQVDLYGFEDTLCQRLSAGQKRRVALARLFLPDAPPLWILDEPLAALDVSGVACLQRRMACHLERGGLIVLTSHQPVELAPLSCVKLADYADMDLDGAPAGGVDVCV